MSLGLQVVHCVENKSTRLAYEQCMRESVTLTNVFSLSFICPFAVGAHVCTSHFTFQFYVSMPSSVLKISVEQIQETLVREEVEIVS